jgi:hypothetical protein
LEFAFRESVFNLVMQSLQRANREILVRRCAGMANLSGRNGSANRFALLANRTLPIAINCNAHPQMSGLPNHNTETVRTTSWTQVQSTESGFLDPGCRYVSRAAGLPLLKLGFGLVLSNVAKYIIKYIIKRLAPPSQGWRTFLRNHAPTIAVGLPVHTG